MSHKPQHGKHNPAPNPTEKHGEEKSNNRHVYVEPGVQIDLVKDLREKYETSQGENTAHNNKVLFWTKIGAFAVIVYAIITGVQWLDLRQNFRVDERAWLQFNAAPDKPGDYRVSWQLSVGQPVTYPLQVVNVGKTAARNVDMKIFIEIVDADKEPQLSRVNATHGFPFGHITTGIVFPSQDFRQVVVRPANGGAPEMATDQEMAAIKDGKSYLAVYGIISYEDVFHIQRWTRFCKFMGNGSFQAKNCAGFNSVDNN